MVWVRWTSREPALAGGKVRAEGPGRDDMARPKMDQGLQHKFDPQKGLGKTHFKTSEMIFFMITWESVGMLAGIL